MERRLVRIFLPTSQDRQSYPWGRLAAVRLTATGTADNAGEARQAAAQERDEAPLTLAISGVPCDPSCRQP